MRVIALAAGLLVCSACASTNAYAQPAPKPAAPVAAKQAAPPPTPPPLSAEQTAKIEQLRVDAVTKVAPLRARVQIKRAEIQAMWAKPKPNRDEILRAEAEIDALHQQIRQAWIDFELAALDVLTPQQRAAGMRACTGPGCGPAMGVGGGAGTGRGMVGRGRGFGRGMGRGPGSGACWRQP